MKKFEAYIDGEFVNSNKQVEIISPLDLQVVGSVPSLDKTEINRAFSVAKKAFKTWKNLEQKTRNEYLEKFNKKLLQHQEALAEIIHLETGKSIQGAISEIKRTSEYLVETVKTWEVIKTKKVELNQKTSYQVRLPLGVVLAISPFNYPVNLSLSKIVPALISGNTIVFKAATNGSLTGGYLAKLFAEINIPRGVFNYVCGAGRDIGDTLIENDQYQMVSFTGSVAVGKKIASLINLRPMVLELGGNDAAYVKNDADLEKAVEQIYSGAFSFAGQRCTAIKRVILHKNISDQFITKLVERAKGQKLDPIITNKSVNYLKSLLDEEKQQKHKIWLEPTFENNFVSIGIIETTNNTRLWNEEQFGPLLPVITVDNDDQALALINDSNFGLQNSLFTEDQKWALSVASKLESGTVNINGKSMRGPDQFPFSGIKDSGWGVQGITDALLSMTRIHNIVINK